MPFLLAVKHHSKCAIIDHSVTSEKPSPNPWLTPIPFYKTILHSGEFVLVQPAAILGFRKFHNATSQVPVAYLRVLCYINRYLTSLPSISSIPFKFEIDSFHSRMFAPLSRRRSIRGASNDSRANPKLAARRAARSKLPVTINKRPVV